LPSSRLLALGTAVTRPTFVGAPKMIPAEVISEVSTFVDNSNLIASNSADFGGLFWPVLGLGGLAGLILFLSPPLKEVE
jgi:hypothetical protein